MNIGEALRADQALVAAARLADRAYSSLHAGYDAADVRQLWPELPDELPRGVLCALRDALDLPGDEPSGPPVTPGDRL